jgi:hypothetical protein
LAFRQKPKVRKKFLAEVQALSVSEQLGSGYGEL